MLLLIAMGLGYAALNGYFLFRLLTWLKNVDLYTRKKRVRVPAIALFIFFSTAVIVSAFLPGGSALKAAYVRVGNIWYGMCLYAWMTLLAADLVRLVVIALEKLPRGPTGLRTRRAHVIAGALCIAIIAAVTIGGTINARVIRVKSFDLSVQKAAGAFQELNVVLCADLHMGYNIGVSHIRQMVDKINAQHPDLVVFAGDIFDNDYDRLEDPDALLAEFRRIESKYGLYACYGNHDVKEIVVGGFAATPAEPKASDPRMDEFLERAGVTLLRDEAVLIDNSVYLYGRPDFRHPGRDVAQRKTPEELTAGLDKTKPIIVLDHEPYELGELARAGVDVDLSGHTHDGQLFPLTLAVDWMWENDCGYLYKDGMHSVVTAGVGLYGPNMRVGTVPDISVIHLRFAKSPAR